MPNFRYQPRFAWRHKDEERQGVFAYANEKPLTKKRACLNHPTSYWGLGYKNCMEGNRIQEECLESTL